MFITCVPSKLFNVLFYKMIPCMKTNDKNIELWVISINDQYSQPLIIQQYCGKK